MTTLTLVQNAGIAIDQAISLIISENKIDEVLEKLNEAKVCTMKMEQMINPPVPPKGASLRREICNAFGIPEENIFKHSRKREIISARQVYVYVIRNTRLKDEDPVQKAKRDSEVVLGAHIGFDHATIYHCEKAVQNYCDTEPFFRDLISRLTNDIISGKLEMPVL